MALNIKNTRTEALAVEVAKLSGQSKTGAITSALEMHRRRLLMERTGIGRAAHLRRFLEEEIWPAIPQDLLGTPITKAEREAILGLVDLGV